jgi:hypothetical protein
LGENAGVKNKTHTVPSDRSELSVLRQVCNLIPNHLVPKLARETGVQGRSRTFSPHSHVVTMLFAQLTHAVSLNDVCDSLQLHSGPLSAVRGATPPSRNNLSHANRVRPAALAEKLFWSTLEHMRAQSSGFGKGCGRRFARRFRATINVVDSTTIALMANCMDWAKHRRRKAAAKCHLRMELATMLPRFVLIESAKGSDTTRAPQVCADLKAGEIALFDRAYVDFIHLYELTQRIVSWVTRTKKNMKFRVVKKRLAKPHGKILRDDEIVLTHARSRDAYPQRMRCVLALVEVDGEECAMEFLTNNMDWAPGSVADLYRARWQIEVFFKQIKQTLQLADFLGNSENAVQWQLWTALLTYILLRYLSFCSQWSGSFIRLWAVVRSLLWAKRDLRSVLERYGTAGARLRCIAQPETLWLPGLRPRAVG